MSYASIAVGVLFILAGIIGIFAFGFGQMPADWKIPWTEVTFVMIAPYLWGFFTFLAILITGLAFRHYRPR